MQNFVKILWPEIFHEIFQKLGLERFQHFHEFLMFQSVGLISHRESPRRTGNRNYSAVYCTAVFCFIVGLEIWLGLVLLVLKFDRLVVMRPYFYYYQLSVNRSPNTQSGTYTDSIKTNQ